MTDRELIRSALKAVKQATGIDYSEASSSELRRVMLELAEDGAWREYEGNGWFDGIHIDNMSDRTIAKILIRDYE